MALFRAVRRMMGSGRVIPVVDEQIARLDLVTIDEASRLLGLHRNSVRKRAQQGTLDGARLNGGKGDWVFRRDVIIAAME